MTNVFIAPKIKVGFQKRDDTFTGQLAYIIYFDDKGKLRKEKSWESWRDKKIDPQEFDNKPLDGFTLNKDVKRSHEWFGSGRNMIRVHDPRGFEFEVTCENLIEILMHTDCLRRGLIGQFVYAWVGSELILLPTNSEEYQQATKFTAGLSKKVKAKEMIPGISYKTKREGDVIFMGKLAWYEYGSSSKSRYSTRLGQRKENRVLVFTNDDGKNFFKKSSADFLSEPNSDTPVSNFSDLMDKFNKKVYANKIVRYEFRPVSFDPKTRSSEHNYGPEICRSRYFMESKTPGIFFESSVAANSKYECDECDESGKSKYVLDGYRFRDDYYGEGCEGVNQTTGEVLTIPTSGTRNRYGYYNNKKYTLEQMQQQKFFDLFVIFEDGKEKKVKSIYELTTGETEY